MSGTQNNIRLRADTHRTYISNDKTTILCPKKTTLMSDAIASVYVKLILIIFGRNVAERVGYQMTVCYLTLPN